MWPDSPFAKPVSSFERPVPLILILPDSEPYMYVRFNRAWLPYILGSLKQLMLQTTWQTEDPNVLNQQQEYAGQILYEFMIGKDTAPVLGSAGADEGENLIRQNPTNPCLLETSIDGINWCAFADMSLCFSSLTSQPAGGTAQPSPNGGCKTYEGKLSARDQWLVPVTLNTGDTLSFASIGGAGTDGTLHWFCQDGEVFFAGVCAGQKSTSGSDPAPTLPHMTLIARIGSNSYDITAGPITVPAGVSGGQCYIQVNDADLTNNSGDYKFTVTVCNNQAGTWTRTYNPADFSALWTIVKGTVDGAGIHTVVDSTSNRSDMYLNIPAGTTINSIQMTGTWGTVGSDSRLDTNLYAAINQGGGTLVAEIDNVPATGAHTYIHTYPSVAAVKTVRVTNGGLINVFSATISQIVLTGAGTPPA